MLDDPASCGGLEPTGSPAAKALKCGHTDGTYGNGQCKTCKRQYARERAAKKAAARVIKPGDRGSGICKRGHSGAFGNDRACKICKANRQREWRKLNPGPGRKYPVAGDTYTCGRGHIAIHQGKGSRGCPECRKMTNRLNRQKPENKAKQKARYDAWRGANPHKVADASRRWQIAHPEEMQVIRVARSSAKKNAPGRLTAAEWRAILKKYKHRCAYCGKRAPKGETLTQDHVVPLRGKDVHGVNYAFNIVPACRKCNTSKNNRVLPGTQHSLFDRLRDVA